MADPTKQLMLRVEVSTEVDAEELADATRQLREELIELEVDDVNFVHDTDIPDKSKALPAINWTTLVVTLAASGGVLTTLINALQSWLSRNEQSSISLEIEGDKLEVTGVSSEEKRRLIKSWLSRHQRRTD